MSAAAAAAAAADDPSLRCGVWGCTLPARVVVEKNVDGCEIVLCTKHDLGSPDHQEPTAFKGISFVDDGSGATVDAQHCIVHFFNLTRMSAGLSPLGIRHLIPETNVYLVNGSDVREILKTLGKLDDPASIRGMASLAEQIKALRERETKASAEAATKML